MAKPDLSTWKTKEEAAEEFGSSVRTVERMVHEGKIETQYRPMPGRRPLLVLNPLDVDKWKTQFLKPEAFIEQDMQQGGSGSKAIALAHSNGRMQPDLMEAIVGAPVKMLAEAIGGLAAPATFWKVYLTLEEAVEFTGLPKAYLIERARTDGLQNIRAFRTGSSGKGPWRFQRKSLEAM